MYFCTIHANLHTRGRADWFHPPEILDVDLSAWNGGIGEAIRMQVQDDVQVAQVTVVITDEADAVLEQGAAVQQEDALWWVYTTTAEASGTPKVIVSAQDLPGHISQVVESGGYGGELLTGAVQKVSWAAPGWFVRS